MRRIIKSIAFVISIILCAPVLADPYTSNWVTVPNQQGGFTFGADLLLLRPSASNLSFDTAFTDSTAATTGSERIDTNNVGYHWGFDLLAAYRFPCTGNDLSLGWTHFGRVGDEASEEHAVSNLTIPLFPPFPVISFEHARIDTDNRADFKYDGVDLDLGQRINIGNYFSAHLVTGVRFANLQQKFNTHYHIEDTTTPTAIVTLDVNQNSQFKGVGPQVGIDGRFCLGYGMGLDFGATVSSIVGRVNSAATLTEDTTEVTDDNITLNLNQDKKTRVIPAFDGYLAADYTYNFNNCSRSSIVFQLGYKVIHYWNVTHFLINSTGPASINIFSITGNRGTSLSFDGPYAGIKVNL